MSDSTSRVVTVTDVLRQVWADWTDKEVQAGYTYTYIWMANQLGHFTLGLLPTFLVSWLILWISGQKVEDVYARYLIWFPLALAAGWAAKEIWDVVRAAKSASNHAFPVDRADLWMDAGTAVFFFWCGIITATLGLRYFALGLASFLVVLILAVVLPARYWLPRKLCFQRARLPYLARLADFTSQFGSAPPRLGPQDVLGFLAAAKGHREGNPLHLLLFGALGTGRTSLAVAVGTEHSFEIRRVRYLTWTKFLELAVHDPTPNKQDGADVWPWIDVDILILDDMVDQSDPAPDVLLAEKQRELSSLSAPARAALGNKRVVWVFGQVSNDTPTPAQWIDLLGKSLELRQVQFGYVELLGGQVRAAVPLASLSG